MLWLLCGSLLVAGIASLAAPPSPPTVDGVIAPKEWSGVRREKLTGGGEVRLLRAGADLYVAVIGRGRGYPSLCVGDSEHVEILHASAALGSVSYTRTARGWVRGKPFAWRLRDAPDRASRLPAERESFFAGERWISTASRDGAPTTEFRIAMTPERRFLGVVFLSTDTMEPAYWPGSIDDGCRNVELLRGDPPDVLPFEPARWHRLE